MKLAAQKGYLSQALQKVQAITEKKSGMPIMSNVLLQASQDGSLDLYATDLELSIRTQMKAQVITPGMTTVSARKLLEVVRELPSEDVTMECLPNSHLLIQSGRARFQLSTIPAEDFPEMKFYEELELSPFSTTVLKNCFGKTLYSIPQDNDPFSVPGVYCHPVGESLLRFVSSDGHRLTYYETSRDAMGDLNFGEGIVIHRKAVQDIIKIIDKEETVSMGMHENRLLVKTLNTTLSIRLLESSFPDYQLIIPDQRPFSFLVNRDDFLSALKRVALLTNLKWRYVRLVISSGMLHLEAESVEMGNAADDLDIDYDGEEFSVAFNVRYVMEAIQVIDSDQVIFEWVDQFHGGVFLDAEDPGYLGLIMPMVV